MPRTVESIVENHMVALERRRAGRPVWDRSINIKNILNRDPDNTSEEHAAAVAQEIAKLLRAKLPAAWLDITSDDWDSEIDEIVEHLESLRAVDFVDDPSWSALCDLNARLDELYDWADARRVWLG